MPGRAARPPFQDEVPESGPVLLPGAGVPPDEASWGWPDPDTGPPAELADLTVAELEKADAIAPPPPVATGAGPAGFWSRDGSGGGSGFADGGVLDVLAPGVPLAGFADAAHARLSGLTDDELIGVLRAWRRQESWAQARGLAVMAELARRRPAADNRASVITATAATGETTATGTAVTGNGSVTTRTTAASDGSATAADHSPAESRSS